MSEFNESAAVGRALISVSDKTGLVEFARGLSEAGIALVSTGGTYRQLAEAGIEVTEISAHTGFPEIMDGRVKTLHPKVHGGILARRGEDEAVMQEHGIEPIDLVVVNLYPFRETIRKPGCTPGEAIENIDIGGPAMIRAAAKNHAHVGVVTAPEDYDSVLAELRDSANRLSIGLRRRLARRAFAHTSAYDAAIANYLATQIEEAPAFPPEFFFHSVKAQDLRYGENPHQRAAFYRDPDAPSGCIASAVQHQGKELSFNNINDTDAALECVKSFSEPACVIVKHANPCGVARADNPRMAYDLAHRTDPTSAFGGIIAFNRAVDGETVSEIIERQFVEVIVAPEYSADALRIAADRKNLRLLSTGSADASTVVATDVRTVTGGLLVQDADIRQVTRDELRVVTEREPDEAELEDLLFAWKVAHFVKSNAIVYARELCTVGIGAGQMSRVDSARIAIIKAQTAKLEVRGSVMASDAFFPFRDAIDAAAEAGVRAIIQPGGSMRDDEVIAAANEAGIAMVFTGIRHFRH